MPSPSFSPAFRLRGETAYKSLDFILQRGDNRIGSAAGNEIVIREPAVSKRHAVIRWKGNELLLEDLGSKNGTFLNGQDISSAAMQPGDQLTLGSVRLILETIDPGDAEVALPYREPRGAKSIDPISVKTTSTLAPELVPGRWLDILERCVDHGPDVTSGGARPALEILIRGVGALAGALIEFGPTGALMVQAVTGAVSPSAMVGRLEELLKSMAEGVLTDGPDVIVKYLDGDPLLAIAASAVDKERGYALVVRGDFPYRSVSAHLLEAFLRFVRPVTPASPLEGIAPAEHSSSGLVFPPDFVPGCSPAIMNIFRQLRHLLRGNLSVLITGETGVGKEHIARILHASSDRYSGPFVAVNCAAIPSELMEAELFGIEKGVATGVEQRDGKFQLAHGGVIFLDEIGDMPLPLQSKVLRALQDRLIWPVGGRRALPVDVRIISSTNRDLKKHMAEGLFRADLYYRVAGYELPVPPLRERREDIPVLAGHFMQQFAGEAGKKIRGVSAKALEALGNAPWPGNVRELENEIRRLVYVCAEGQPITSAMLAPEITAAPEAPAGNVADGIGSNLPAQVADLERRAIARALAETKGNRSRAAKLLGLSRNQLSNKITRLGLDA